MDKDIYKRKSVPSFALGNVICSKSLLLCIVYSNKSMFVIWTSSFFFFLNNGYFKYDSFVFYLDYWGSWWENCKYLVLISSFEYRIFNDWSMQVSLVKNMKSHTFKEFFSSVFKWFTITMIESFQYFFLL